MAKQLIVPGHTLPLEGRLAAWGRIGNGPGPARCSCGWESESLPTTAARQREHRAHKMEVIGYESPNKAAMEAWNDEVVRGLSQPMPLQDY